MVMQQRQPAGKRGRPKGTGRDDDALLRAVADECGKGLNKPSAAIRTVVKRHLPEGSTHLNVAMESIVRRLTRKWHDVGGRYLAERAARIERENAERARQQAVALAEGFMQFQRQFAEVAGRTLPWVLAAAERAAPTFQAMMRDPGVQAAFQFAAKVQAIKNSGTLPPIATLNPEALRALGIFGQTPLSRLPAGVVTMMPRLLKEPLT